ncbi:cupin domain-containing protein [Streptomyces sp. NPDC048442]|uniref:cupin domain-containing protein n=1 Tax=Streptomyces sp. NPDC048442 TaxID=3154823 RepID=UPI00343B30BA
MPIQTGNQFPYPEFRKRHARVEQSPIVWNWGFLAKEIEAAEHTPYGTLTLATPDGNHEVVPGTSMTFQSVRPGERTTPHSHSWWHLYFVRAGSGTVVFEKSRESVELSTDDIMLIPAWQVHYFENQEDSGDLLLLNMSNLPQLAALHNNFSKEHA